MITKTSNQSFTYLIETDSFNVSWTKDFIYEIKKSDISLKDLILSEKSREKVVQVINEYKNSDKLKTFHNLGPIRKIILNWESGCGKTTTALALANELNRWIIIVNLSEIISSRLGETSKNLNQVIKYAKDNNYIIFFDEFDSISRHRSDEKELWEMRRLVNSLIQLLDFLPENLLIIGATNSISSIDNAILRRFEEVVLFEKPLQDEIAQYLAMLEYNFDGKVAISKTKGFAKKFLGLDFFKIKTIINSAVKKKVLKSSKNKISITIDDIIL